MVLLLLDRFGVVCFDTTVTGGLLGLDDVRVVGLEVLDTDEGVVLTGLRELASGGVGELASGGVTGLSRVGFVTSPVGSN